jgi:hypothetical protein
MCIPASASVCDNCFAASKYFCGIWLLDAQYMQTVLIDFFMGL